MNQYTTVNILDLLEAVGEDETRDILSDFKCSRNTEIENYLMKNAIEFAKRKMSITYLVVNEGGRIAAYFTLAHKPAIIPSDLLSNNSRKKIERHAKLDEDTKAYNVSAFLIAQFGKNEGLKDDVPYSGVELMDQAMNILRNVQRQVGGGIIFLECENRPKLLQFYQNPQNRFWVYGERYSDSEQVLYKQLLRIF